MRDTLDGNVSPELASANTEDVFVEADLVISPPVQEPEWVRELVASKPRASTALENLIGLWEAHNTEGGDNETDADVLAALKEYTCDPR